MEEVQGAAVPVCGSTAAGSTAGEFELRRAGCLQHGEATARGDRSASDHGSGGLDLLGEHGVALWSVIDAVRVISTLF
jgi:hypothetical protein